MDSDLFFAQLRLWIVIILMFYTLQHNGQLFSNRKKRIKLANEKIIDLFFMETPENILFKIDNQLQSFFETKGHLYYHVFTTEGEFYVQFRFVRNNLKDYYIKKQSNQNVIPMNLKNMY